MFRLRGNPFGLASCAALAFFIGASDVRTGHAEDPAERVVSVSTRGTDLASAAGQQQLRLAIERAARKVCLGSDEHLGTWGRDYLQCHDNAVAGAMAQLRILVAHAAPAVPQTEMLAERTQSPD